jgi:hypothetical protein
MRKRAPLIAIAVAVALFVAGFVMASWLPTAPAAAKETITVIEHASSDTTVDLGEEGDSVGDTLVFANEVYDADDANAVGSDQGSCVRTKKGEAWECTLTTTLDNGSIAVQGPFYDDGRDATWAITGGTGEYSGASGQMTLKARDNGEKFEFTFELN